MHEVVRRSLVDHAVALARGLEDPLAVYMALMARSLSMTGPESIDQRLATRHEIVQWAEQMGDKSPLLDAYMYRIDDLLALGDIDGVDADIRSMEAVSREMGEPFYDYCLTTKRAMRGLLEGRFADAERQAQLGMDCSRQMDVDNAEGVFGMQMFSIRRLQGRLQGLAPIISHFVTSRPNASCWRPGLALVYSEIGDKAAARVEFESLAGKDFQGVPRDSLWQTCLSFLSDVCAFLGDRDRAAILYELMLPYAELTVVVGNSVTCNGAASRNLGQLAAVMRQWEEAEQHFQHAIDFNGRLKALPWLAITKHQYAEMLLARADPGDGERAEGLQAESLALARMLDMRKLIEGAENDTSGDASS